MSADPALAATLQAILDTTSATTKTLTTMSATQTELVNSSKVLSTKIDTVETTLSTKLDDVKGDVTTLRQDVDGKFATVHTRIDQLEKFRNAQGKLNTNMSSRISALEKAVATKAGASDDDRMSDEMAKVATWVREAAFMETTVIIGATKDNPALDRRTLDGIMTNFQSAVTYIVKPKGRSGVFSVAFEDQDAIVAKAAARGFVSYLTTSGAVDGIWAKHDEPTNLRMAQNLARSFAFEFKKKLEDAPFFQLIEGYLIFGSVVISPVSLIPDKTHWPELESLILKVLNRPHSPFSFMIPPSRQLRREICVPLLKMAQNPSYIRDLTDDVEDFGGDTVMRE